MSNVKDDTTTIDSIKNDTAKPKMWSVIFHNDDYTPQAFVVEMLQKHFRMDEASAYGVMMKVHTSGKGIAGTYTREIAETRAVKVVSDARENDYPLEVTLEPAS